MLLQIRNMESDRCKSIVKYELSRLGFGLKSIELGEVDVEENLMDEQLRIIDSALRISGLELIYDKRNNLVEKIKTAVNQLINRTDDFRKENFSEYLSKTIRRDYTYLSNLFSSMQGITIERYIISCKIERIKELLVISNMNLSSIAFILKYSSVAHLSNQFKKETGQTPSVFRQLVQCKSENDAQVTG